MSMGPMPIRSYFRSARLHSDQCFSRFSGSLPIRYWAMMLYWAAAGE